MTEGSIPKVPGVGRGRPPVHSRFQPGVSGNPKGRPPKERDLKKLIEQELDETLFITENGKRTKLTKRELIAKGLVNDAAKGNARALSTLVKIVGTTGEPENVFAQCDPSQLAAFVARFLASDDAG